MIGSHNIFLVGPMGSGKTAVGRQIARLLKISIRRQRPRDRDAHRRRYSADFRAGGEAGFRRREREAIAELSARTGIVLATGGGAVLDAGNRRVSPSAAGWYTSRPRWRSRPSAPAARAIVRCSWRADPSRRLEELMRVREPLYREIADFIATDHAQARNPVAERIVQDYRTTRAAARRAGR